MIISSNHAAILIMRRKSTRLKTILNKWPRLGPCPLSGILFEEGGKEQKRNTLTYVISKRLSGHIILLEYFCRLKYVI
jgi:hypothetical protein